MNKRYAFSLFIAILFLLSACEPSKKPVFDITGSPETLFYGGTCPTPVLTFTVSGPGDGLSINSIIVAYQLFDGSGNKINEATHSLHPVPYAPSVTYDTSKIISIPVSGGSSSAPDSPMYDFGEGRVDFAATVYAKILSPPITGPDETYYFTSTKSIPVLPCPPVTIETIDQGPGDIIITREAPTQMPEPNKKPKDSGDAPPPPPSCSVEPNNPSCVP